MLAVSPSEGNSSFAYAPRDVIASKYQLEQLIGEGGIGAVFRARNARARSSPRRRARWRW